MTLFEIRNDYEVETDPIVEKYRTRLLDYIQKFINDSYYFCEFQSWMGSDFFADIHGETYDCIYNSYLMSDEALSILKAVEDFTNEHGSMGVRITNDTV